ncbi:MAG: hypothetical protein LC687_06230 [Actinobacteria bacterium]|nr:hypothetical protein [Actinomycetota bacterium]
MTDNNKPQNNNQTGQSPQPEPASDSQKKTVKIILIVVGVLVILGIIGVALLGYVGSKIGSSVLEDVTNSENIEISDDGVTIESEDGSFSSTQNQELPDNFPAQVPLFDDSDIISSSRFSQDRGTVWSVSFETSRSADEVYEYYETQFEGEDWDVQSSFESGSSRSVSAVSNNDDMRVGVTINQDDNNTTTYTLSVTEASGEEG